MIDFPTSPVTGQQYTYLGRIWQWSGVGWAQVINQSQIVSVFVPLFPINLHAADALPLLITVTWTQLNYV